MHVNIYDLSLFVPLLTRFVADARKGHKVREISPKFWDIVRVTQPNEGQMRRRPYVRTISGCRRESRAQCFCLLLKAWATKKSGPVPLAPIDRCSLTPETSCTKMPRCVSSHSISYATALDAWASRTRHTANLPPADLGRRGTLHVACTAPLQTSHNRMRPSSSPPPHARQGSIIAVTYTALSRPTTI